MLFDLVIVGGGIIGCSVAKAWTERYPRDRVLLLEKEAGLATHQSGRNSGVIHSGIYYQPGSLKAKTCVAGALEMHAFCREHGLPLAVCGKVIVATSAGQLAALDDLRRRGEANGVRDIRQLTSAGLREIEPHCAGVAALHVPTTAVTDFAQVAAKYAELAAGRGAEIRTSVRVAHIEEREAGVRIETSAGEFTARQLVNCAGLHSDALARAAGVALGLRIVPFRGEYYELSPERRGLVRALIYPVPDPRFPFLGVHFTRRVDGTVDAGPNAVLALRREGYDKFAVSPRDALATIGYAGFWRMAARFWRAGLGEMHRSFSKRAFVEGLQRLVPEISAKDLRPSGAGVRAQAVDRTGKLLDDFAYYGSRRALHVCNVPSPAATASLPLGRIIVHEAATRSGKE